MLRFVCALMGLVIALPAHAAPDETEVLREWNELRANPPAFARYLEVWLPHFRGNLLELPTSRRITFEGAAAVREAIALLKATGSLPDVQASPLMALAAREHVRDLGPRGGRGHQGADGSSVGDRLQRHGQWYGSVSESCTFGAASAIHTIMELVIDDGVASRGHRAMLLRAKGGMVGIACGPHRDYGSMCVLDLADDFTAAALPAPAVAPPDVITPFDDTKPFALPPPEAPRGTPSQLDLAVLAEINELRTNPLAWAAKLEALLPLFQGPLLHRPRQVTLFWPGAPASVQQAIALLKDTPALPAVPMQPGLAAGVRDFVRVRRAQPSDNERYYSPYEAARRYGAGALDGAMTMRGEAAAFDILATWFVRGPGPNRTFLDPRLRQLGVGCGPGHDKPIACALVYGSGAFRDFHAGDLDLQRQALDHLNRARTDPRAAARSLRSLLPSVLGETLRAAGGVAPLPGGGAALAKLIGRLELASPLPPLKAPPQLTARARDLVVELAPGRVPGGGGSWGVRDPWRYGQPDGAARPDELVVFAPGGDDLLALQVLLAQPDWLLAREEVSVGLWCGSHATKGQVCVVDAAVGWVVVGQPLPRVEN